MNRAEFGALNDLRECIAHKEAEVALETSKHLDGAKGCEALLKAVRRKSGGPNWAKAARLADAVIYSYVVNNS